MSMYNMLNGANPATFFILPMLGQHPDFYGRFRDCWVNARQWTLGEDGMPVMEIKKDGDEEEDAEPNTIYVFTRLGGGNREDYQETIDAIRALPEYLTDYDDEFDCTYATFVFSVPEKFKADYDKVIKGKLAEVSPEYIKQLYQVYPKLKDKFDEIFGEQGAK